MDLNQAVEHDYIPIRTVEDAKLFHDLVKMDPNYNWTTTLNLVDRANDQRGTIAVYPFSQQWDLVEVDIQDISLLT